jgi:hypothetical protein
VQDDRVGAVKKFLGGRLKVRGFGVQHSQIDVGAQEFHNAVRFNNGVSTTGENLAQVGQGFR